MLVRPYGRGVMTGLCVAVTAAFLISCSGGSKSTSDAGTGKSAQEPTGTSAGAGAGTSVGSSASQKPNIVFVLTDDLSWNLVQYMPHVVQMEKAGTTFSNFFATDSQCCPSRSSIFTGEYPHNTGVFTNVAPDGGYDAFVKNGDERKCFAPALQGAGYRTGFMGKYLNEYKTKPGNPGKVPPGWNEWDATGGAYKEFNYSLNENGKAVSYGHQPKDYLTDVLSAKASSFVDTSAQAKKPFMLEVSTFAPHAPFVPAPRDKNKFPGITAPRTGAYDRPPTPAPKWESGLTPLTAKDQKQIDNKFGKRVRSVQAVDEMIGHLESELQAKGLARNTYFMFASDNGLHMGEHRLRSGKQTAYDTDIKVPLMVMGPGVPLGAQVSQLTENVDLNPTFQELAGVKPQGSVDGQSLVPLIHGHPEDDWRQAVLIEHHHSATKKGDPDAAPKNAGDPPSYEAIRTADAVYVEYADGEREYYSVKSDPDELRNLAPSLSAGQRASLHETLTALEHCKGSSACRAAARTTM